MRLPAAFLQSRMNAAGSRMSFLPKITPPLFKSFWKSRWVRVPRYASAIRPALPVPGNAPVALRRGAVNAVESAMARSLV